MKDKVKEDPSKGMKNEFKNAKVMKGRHSETVIDTRSVVGDL